MPFNFQEYDGKCAAMTPDELQREWQHYTRLISSASTSTAVSGLALPLTCGVSLIGVGMAAPAIHNARKKREIIERHLQRHGTTHNTRKRDVVGSMALSGTIGVVTLGVGSMGADAVATAGAEHGISAVVENEMAIKVATHAALDGAGLAIEHGLHGHVKEKDAHKAFQAAGTFQAVADAKAREAGYAVQPYPYGPQPGYGVAGSSTGVPQPPYVLSYGGQMPPPPPYSGPAAPIALADAKTPAVAPQLLAQAYTTGNSGYPSQQPYAYGDQSRQGSISGYQDQTVAPHAIATPQPYPAPGYPQDTTYPRHDSVPPTQQNPPANYPSPNGVDGSRGVQSPQQYATPPHAEIQGQPPQSEGYPVHPAQTPAQGAQHAVQNAGSGAYDMSAMNNSLPELTPTPAPGQNQPQQPEQYHQQHQQAPQYATHQEAQQPSQLHQTQAPQPQQAWQQQQQQQEQPSPSAVPPAAQTENVAPHQATPQQQPAVIVPVETPVLHAPRPAAPQNPAVALAEYVSHPTPAPMPAPAPHETLAPQPYTAPAPQAYHAQVPQPPAQQYHQPPLDPVQQPPHQYVQPHVQQPAPAPQDHQSQPMSYPAYSVPLPQQPTGAPTYQAAAHPPPPPPPPPASSYQPANYPPAATYQPPQVMASYTPSPAQTQSYAYPPHQVPPTSAGLPAGGFPPSAQSYLAQSSSYAPTPPYTPTHLSVPQSSPPPHQQQQQPQAYQPPPSQHQYQPPPQQQQPAHDPYAAIPLAPLTRQPTYPQEATLPPAQSYPQHPPQSAQTYAQQQPPPQAAQSYPQQQHQAGQPYTLPQQQQQHQQATPAYPHHAMSPPPQNTYAPTPPISTPCYGAPPQQWSGQAQWPAQVPGAYTPAVTPGGQYAPPAQQTSYFPQQA